MNQTNPRGRPATGRTPDAERQRRSRARRTGAGGHHISLTLDATTAEHLGIVMLVKGCDIKEAIEYSLADVARRIG